MAMVYWIHGREHTDPAIQGYVGVARNNGRHGRVKQHFRALRGGRHVNPHLQAAFKSRCGDVIVGILLDGSVERCLQHELVLRPVPEIGWNILPGGGDPPSHAGKQWWTNGRQNVISADCPDGFKPGKIQFKNNHGLRGVAKSAEHRAKIRASLAGRRRSPEAIAMQVAATKGRPKPKIECPHCHQYGGVGPMTRWHFDRCMEAR